MTQLARPIRTPDAEAPVLPPPARAGRVARPQQAARLVRLERPRLGDDPKMNREVEAFPARLLGGLPVASTLWLHVPGVEGRPVAVATSAVAAATARAAGLVAFDAGEWEAVVVAAESDRLWPADFRSAVARKHDDEAARLELGHALGDARPDPARGWSVGRVLDRIGAKLVRVEIGP
jgi:hypothetical protein